MNRLAVSFSGGRTSAFMAAILRHVAEERVFVFANTSQEHEQTLRFVDAVDKYFDLGVVWLEALVDPRENVGTSYKIVTFETATRDGRVFESVIQKYGIPNKVFPNCNREMKLRPIYAYLKDLGWEKGTYKSAIGIRADEQDRVSSRADEDGLWYPLVEMGITKDAIFAFWKSMPFDLQIPEHLGNCTWCWKKSLRKHLTLAIEYPEIFDFPRRMMEKYPDAGPGDFMRPRRFFRGGLTVEDVFEKSQQPFERFTDKNYAFDPDLDTGGGCGETCEIGADE